ncbi:hypothetical protein SAMN05444412_106120 [Rhodonellum ikkaensis]|uniref:Uncharacterized protein n=1 Tax=Rhodonellum ikkaensis TaxID=336829 RepID=A0A1H3QIS3_9BACT|nr:hypothetical protein SAMN05444412_106120 [Rhodonellum ikkaensis]
MGGFFYFLLPPFLTIVIFFTGPDNMLIFKFFVIFDRIIKQMKKRRSIYPRYFHP